MSRSIRSFAFACLAVATAGVPFSYASASMVVVASSLTQPHAVMTDGNILAMLMAVNDTEIGAANAAIEKRVDGDVKGYAEMMVKHHTENNADTKKLADKLKITPVESDECKAMKLKEAEHLKEIKMLDKPAFEKAYVEMMVAGHTAVLGKLDLAINATQNAELKEHLEDTKKTVQHHLDEAKEIQEDMAKKM